MSLFSDLPITKKEQDAFGRTKFIDDLTNFIAKQGVESEEKKEEHRSISDNLVIGIYGPWGSGKTSVVNCVQHELNQKDFDTIYFNPWRYKDEDLLLLDLFKLIASKINKKLNGEKKELFSKVLLKYAKYIVVPKINLWGVEVDAKETVQGGLEALGDFLKEENTLDDYKDKINGFLNELDKPIVIFVDDIDRLDKHEIQLVFKTIKLTAAFSNIIYVLSFDDEMVAKSIGENYGEGREKDGKDFIEKIIQVPLRLPSYASDSIFSLVISNSTLMLQKDVERNNIVLTSNKVKFGSVYNQLITTLISTPREAKRYSNSLNFIFDSEIDVSTLDISILEVIRLKLPSTFKEIIKLNNFINSNVNDSISLISFRETLRGEMLNYATSRVNEIGIIGDALTFIFGINIVTSDFRVSEFGLGKHPDSSLEDKSKRIIDKKNFNKYLQFNKPSV